MLDRIDKENRAAKEGLLDSFAKPLRQPEDKYEQEKADILKWQAQAQSALDAHDRQLRVYDRTVSELEGRIRELKRSLRTLPWDDLAACATESSRLEAELAARQVRLKIEYETRDQLKAEVDKAAARLAEWRYFAQQRQEAKRGTLPRY